MKRNLLRSLGPFVGLSLFAVALWVLHHELAKYHYHDIGRRVGDLSALRLVFAGVLTILSYIVLTGYDTLALHYIRHPLAYSKIALTSFVSYAFSHNIGLSVLTGGSVRYRLYSAWGLSAVEVTQVVAFCGLTFWLGFLTLGGLVFIVEPPVVPSVLALPFAAVRPVGAIFLSVIGLYLLASLVRKRPLTIREWEFVLPSPRFSLMQTAVSAVDWALAAGVLYALLPAAETLSYPRFLGMYLLAQIAGLVSQIPGGLGIFETVLLLLLSATVPPPAIVGAMLAYRVIYYLLPFAIAAVLFATHEALQRKKSVQQFARMFGQWVPALTPHVLAFSTFVGGAILLFSGATPAVHSRLGWLTDVLPLPVIETSHFLGSLAGVGLLLLARGLQQRLDAAYHLTVLLLSAGIVFSLLKGFDYEEAIALGVMLAALWPCRRHFYRQASLIDERFTPGWVAAILLILLGSVWLGLFSYKHLEYAHELWWQFALNGNAPRFLRATIGALSVAVVFAVARLLRPAPPEPTVPSRSELDCARTIIAHSPTTSANLAFLGDKTLLFDETNEAFLMYGVEGRSWVALGDPVGPPSAIPELVWRFRELCDRYGDWPVFYQVSADNLPLYLDLGLSLLKLGEEGRVRLETFSLQGNARKGLRHVVNHVEKEGCTFALIARDAVPPLLPELRVISDAWLDEKHTREKGFSLGSFAPLYLQEFPVAVVRQAGKIVAFANLWLGADKEELSPDLMRYLPDAPHDVMDYLFIQLLLWGKHEGYQWFNLGMAPLSGLEDHALAPLWNRLGALVFRHGEHFYNFQGVRQYKEKFDPEWEPRYLASPGGLALPRILTNVAALIAGGLKGVVAK